MRKICHFKLQKFTKLVGQIWFYSLAMLGVAGIRTRYSDLEEHDVSTTTDWCYELFRSELLSPLFTNAPYQSSAALVAT